MTGLSDRTIDIKCPTCGRTSKRSIAWVKNNTTFTCACGRETRLDSPEFKANVAKEEAEFQEREQAIKNVGR
jgi:endogenous inhibitor of DNA gyrase (YacG/DUF329 family)